MVSTENNVDMIDIPQNEASITPKVEKSKLKKENKPPSKNLSFFSLFKYSNTSEKIMIFFGIIGAIGQGLTVPFMIKIMGDLINLFISLVVSGRIRDAAGVDRDDNSPVGDLYIKIAMNLIQFSLANLDISGFQVPKGMTEKEMMDLMMILYKSREQYWHEFHQYMLYLGLIALFSFIASFLMDALFTISAMRQVTKIRSYTFESMVKQEIPWHETTSPGELASRIINDTILIENGISLKLGTVIQNVVSFISCFILAFKAGWKLSLSMSVIIPIILIFVVYMTKILRKYTKKTQDAFAELGNIAQEAFSQIRTVVSFGTEQKEIDRYVNKLLPTKKYGMIKGHTVGIILGLVYGVIYASYAIAFIYGTRLIQNNEMMYGDVLNVFMGIMMGTMMLSSVGADLSAFSEATGAATTIFEIIERKPQISLDEGFIPDENEKEKKPLEGHIEFQEVHFHYPSRPEVEVLKGISFQCLPGQTVAIVGASGSGKSTLIQLLERFYTKTSGRILIDGKDIEEYNVKWLRSQIGLVSQEPTLFDISVAQNISIHVPGATQEEIEAAAKLANAHNFILELSNGYETTTGERGLQLSGGQKQRICIARALINNPKILLLDEATSALDNTSEKLVQAALDSAASGRTTIIIAHRLSTIKNADLIVVMENGVIIESGVHEELMALRKHYYNLVNKQEMIAKENEKDEDDEEEEIGKKEGEGEGGGKMEKKDTVDTIQKTKKSEEDNEAAAAGGGDASVRHETTTMLGRIASSLLSIRQSTSKINTNDENKKNNQDNTDYSLQKSMPWKRYLNYNRPYWLPNCFGFIGALFNGGMTPAFAYIFASAMNAFTFQGDALLERGLFWGIMFIVLGVANFFAYYFNLGGFIIAGEHITYDLRKRMYDNMIRQEVGFFDTNDIGDGSEKVAGGQDPGGIAVAGIGTSSGGSSGSGSGSNGSRKSTGTLTAKLATEAGLVHDLNKNVGLLFQQVVTTIGGFGIAFVNGWKLTLILLVTVPFLFLGSAFKLKASQTRNQENRIVFEQSSKVATEAIVSIKTIYALNLSDYFNRLYREKLNEPMKRLERKAYLSSIGTGYSNAIAFFAYILGYWVGSWFIENDEMGFDKMFMILMAIILTAMAVGQSSTVVSETQKAVDAFIHVLEIIDRTPKIDARDPAGLVKNGSGSGPENEFHGELEFSEIRFQYPSRPEVTVIRMGSGKKISIPAGKMCAFVGSSGSGKSTIIGLLPRWYDARHGAVKVDGISNKEYNVRWLREQIGLVNQEPCLFNISIKENIKYGKQDATDDEIYAAAKKANIHDFIMTLPEKYDTLVGGMGTSQMSGGQKQRVAIARAMIRNPKILLLDEATSALDAESELIVQKALEEASEGRTTIMIAHRLSTIRDADQICVFREGRIIEMGNHQELMDKKGEYYNMVLAGDGTIKMEKQSEA